MNEIQKTISVREVKQSRSDSFKTCFYGSLKELLTERHTCAILVRAIRQWFFSSSPTAYSGGTLGEPIESRTVEYECQ